MVTRTWLTEFTSFIEWTCSISPHYPFFCQDQLHEAFHDPYRLPFVVVGLLDP